MVAESALLRYQRSITDPPCWTELGTAEKAISGRRRGAGIDAGAAGGGGGGTCCCVCFWVCGGVNCWVCFCVCRWVTFGFVGGPSTSTAVEMEADSPLSC